MDMRELAAVIIWITLGFTAVGAAVLTVHSITQAWKASVRRRWLAREALELAAIQVGKRRAK